jgi:hypothetical protein
MMVIIHYFDQNAMGGWSRSAGVAAAVAKPSPQRRCADNKSARWARKNIAHEQNLTYKSTKAKQPAVFQSPKRQSEYPGYRATAPDRAGISMSVLIGAAMIATAILLSTLITAVGTRFVGMESPAEESVWLIDRLTGTVYRCQAPERGKASCDAEIATGSVGGQQKH